MQAGVRKEGNVQDLFDTACLTIPTAVKALWLLYRRGRWDLLKRVGVKRGQAERVLLGFEDAGTFGVGGNLKSQKQMKALLRTYPPLLDAAVRLVGVYMIAMGPEVKNETISRYNQER